MIENKYRRNDDETRFEYETRCYCQKKSDNDITWDDLAVTMNSELGEIHDESYYRKRAKRLIPELDLSLKQDAEDLNNEYSNLLLEIKKEKIKLSDERNQNNAYIRKLAREETLKEIAHDFAEKMSAKKILKPERRPVVKNSDSAGILMLSDWHYGIEINNYFNTYNREVFEDRIDNLTATVLQLMQEKQIGVLHVVNLSDLIAGRIHETIRLQSREDVISQVMYVSEVLAEMLTLFSNLATVVYHDVLDNHSRIEPNHKDSLDLESLARIIPWYLKERLIHNKKILIDDNQVATDIVSFEIGDFRVAAVHGHKDKPNKVVDNMMNMIGEKNDLVLTAHLHHFACEEEHECIRVSNGTLMGVDNFAEDLRLTSKPSQTMIIVTPDNVCSEIRRILVE